MGAQIRVERVGPLTSVQDAGRFGFLEHGISASGPMDAGAFAWAGLAAGSGQGAGIEFSTTGIGLSVSEGEVALGWAGARFVVTVNGTPQAWPGSATLDQGDTINILPGASGNYGYLRFAGTLDVPLVMGSRATNLRARLGGREGRVLQVGDVLAVAGDKAAARAIAAPAIAEGPIRFIWGIHAEVFPQAVRHHFVTSRFRVSPMMDRMGVRLRDEDKVFAQARILSLVSDPVVCGDIQILGDGTPIVLGRDHQPTGGYPRIGTVIAADLDRFFQKRPNEAVAFSPVGLDHAQALLRGGTT